MRPLLGTSSKALAPRLIAFTGLLGAISQFAPSARADLLPPPPPPRTGFQMAFEPGYALPFGRVRSAPNSDLSDVYNGEVLFLPIVVGWKFLPSLFLGTFLDFGIGGAGGQSGRQCSATGSECVSDLFRTGIDVAYNFLPANAINPWVRYGIGLEASALSQSTSGTSTGVGYGGWFFADFTAGVDWRAAPGAGVGPFVDVEIGRYDTQTVTTSGGGQVRSTPSPQAVHGWVTIGVRLVIMP
jgi:hypothetical protein